MFRVRSFYAFAFVRCLLHLAIVFAPVTKLERYIGITVFVCPCTEKEGNAGAKQRRSGEAPQYTWVHSRGSKGMPCKYVRGGETQDD